MKKADNVTKMQPDTKNIKVALFKIIPILICLITMSACQTIDPTTIDADAMYDKIDSYLSEKYNECEFTRLDSHYEYKTTSNGPWFPNVHNTELLYISYYNFENTDYPVTACYDYKTKSYKDNMTTAKNLSEKLQPLYELLPEDAILSFNKGENPIIYTSKIIYSDSEIKILYRDIQKIYGKDIYLKLYSGLSETDISDIKTNKYCINMNDHHIIVTDISSKIDYDRTESFCKYECSDTGITSKSIFGSDGEKLYQVFDSEHKYDTIDRYNTTISVSQVESNACYCPWEVIA